MKKAVSKFLILVMMITTCFTLVACGDPNKLEKAEYNIVVAYATIPALMGGMEVMANEKTTYMFYERINTFNDMAKLKAKVKLVGMDNLAANGRQQLTQDTINQLVSSVRWLKEKNKNSFFNIYVTSYLWEVAERIIIQNKLDDAHYKVIMLEDGTGDYNEFARSYVTGQTDMTANFVSKIAEVNARIEALKSNPDWVLNQSQSWVTTLAYSTRKNVEYRLQYPELLSEIVNKYGPEGTDSTNPFHNFLYKEVGGKNVNANNTNAIHAVKTQLTDTYNKMTVKQKSDFVDMVFGQDNKANFELQFNKDGKPNLMITGGSFNTNTVGWEAAGRPVTSAMDYQLAFSTAFDKIVAQYGETYNIFFKPHPNWDPNNQAAGGWAGWTAYSAAERTAAFNAHKQYFSDNKINVLPAAIPAETFIWAYNVDLGGYDSSLYMNTKPNKVKFFIMADESAKNNLVLPLSLLFIDVPVISSVPTNK